MPGSKRPKQPRENRDRSLQLGAVYWYAEALPQLDGLQKIQIEKRLAQFDRETSAAESRPKNPTEMPPEYTVAIGPGVGLNLRLIRPGKFQMGSPSTEPGRGSDEVQHLVEFTYPFYIGIFEVTQEQWTALMGNNPSLTAQRHPRKPVTKVSWSELRRLSMR